MILCLDVGNSETTLGVFESSELGRSWRMATRAKRTSDEQALALSGLLDLEGVKFESIAGVAVASVVPAVTKTLSEMCVRYLDLDPLIVGPGIKTGVPVLIDNPKEVGADRIANSVATQRLYGGPAVVIDLGTATTFDIVSGAGEYLGGAIAPGIEMWSEVLATGTAQLKRVDLVMPHRLIGKSTVEALQSGIVAGYTSFLEGMITRLSDELGGSPKTVLSGGLAETFAENLPGIDVVDPWLTLKGLQFLFELNTD